MPVDTAASQDNKGEVGPIGAVQFTFRPVRRTVGIAMESWHFIENFIILVYSRDEVNFKASTFEAGFEVVCEASLPDLTPRFLNPSSQTCKTACSDAIWQRKSKTGFHSAADILSRILGKYGEFDRTVEGVTVKVEKRGQMLVATATQNFETYSLALDEHGNLQDPVGSGFKNAFDPASERMYVALRKALAFRKDWDLAASLKP